MNRVSAGLLAGLLLTNPALSAPDVIASIRPLQSLVASVMAGIGEPAAIVKGAGSPHDFAMTPSLAAAIAKADLLFWIGPELEVFLVKPIESLGAGVRVVGLLEADGIVHLPLREGGPFEEHEDEATAGETHHDDGVDAHVWLDPQNAKSIVAAAAAALAKADPANAAGYAQNAARTAARLDALESELRGILEPAHGKRFIVFHDAFQYFENRFGVPATGSITVHPEIAPGAERIAEMRAKLRDLGVACVFSEPQFSAKLADTVIEGTNARKGVLDPDGGVGLADGPELYFTLMRTLARSLRDCLAPNG